MDLTMDIQAIELLKGVTVNTATAAKYLGRSCATVRRYTTIQGAKKLRNVGADGSFRFAVYDLMVKRQELIDRHAKYNGEKV
ncbi:MAG: hypothetical protein SNH18_10375 [Rikenellaceae bacterium]